MVLIHTPALNVCILNIMYDKLDYSRKSDELSRRTDIQIILAHVYFFLADKFECNAYIERTELSEKSRNMTC